MYFAWGFPLLHVAVFDQGVNDLNMILSAFATLMFVVIGLTELANMTNGREELTKRGVRVNFLCILAGVLFWVIGLMPILLVGLVLAVLWYFVWKILIYWFIWRVLILNFWYATWGTIPEREVRTRRTRTKPGSLEIKTETVKKK